MSTTPKTRSPRAIVEAWAAARLHDNDGPTATSELITAARQHFDCDHHSDAPEFGTRPTPRGPTRTCGRCGAILRRTNPDTLCAPCDERETARIRAATQAKEAAERERARVEQARREAEWLRAHEASEARENTTDRIAASLAYIAQMTVELGEPPSTRRYELRRRREGLVCLDALRRHHGGTWQAVLDAALAHNDQQEDA